MSDLIVELAADKAGPYQPGEPLAVTVTARQPATVTVKVEVTAPDGTTAAGELAIPVQVPGSAPVPVTVTSATDSAGDSFTQELGSDGLSVVLRTTVGTPPA